MDDHRPDRDLTVVTLARPSSAKHWEDMPSVARVVTFDHASATGKRFGKLAFGLGVDSAVVAIKASLKPRTGSYLATNPWIAIPLKALTRKRVIVTGLYATPGTRSWRMLARALHDSPIITLATVEAENWKVSGGQALPVIYGNDFPYSSSPEIGDGVTRIFIGGSSDRDLGVVNQLEREILESGEPVELLTAVGEGPRVIESGPARVEHFGRVTQSEFGALIARSDVSFLPLRPRGRAAGHMILVGSLQVGTPVVFCGASGMEGYSDGVFVRGLDTAERLLPQLLRVATSAPPREITRAFWRENFSRAAYMNRISEAIQYFSGESDWARTRIGA
ncbi:hypothetical protein [uncultured Microbacterium sp.]|uniref:hypothetical protein n=1 Tax=uncultured Microbacterium sp. TaxID=191216 RepID=UPI0028D7C0E5|nr:hypothetical protein [uncultured Microbacterium sp.]